MAILSGRRPDVPAWPEFLQIHLGPVSTARSLRGQHRAGVVVVTVLLRLRPAVATRYRQPG